MPEIGANLSNRGAILDVGLSASSTMLRHGGRTATYSALIDTGAEITFISPIVVAYVRPIIVGRTYVNQAKRFGLNVATYDVRLRFEGHLTPGRWFKIEAPEVQPALPNIDIIIGRDLLQFVRMTWDGPGGSSGVEYI